MILGGNAAKLLKGKLTELLEGTSDVVDIGTSQRFAKELRPYEGLFAGKRYVAAGFNPSIEFGQYSCDLHQDIESMTFPDNAFDAVICMEVLEHVRNPFKAVEEIKRILRPRGRLLLSVPFLSQYHGKGGISQSHSEYPDFWRFTHQGLHLMFHDFHRLEVFAIDGPIEFRLKQFYLSQALNFRLIRALVDWMDTPRLGKSTTRHLVFGVK